MATQCPKCGYVRQPNEEAPDWQCPKCGIVYAKFEAKQAASREERQRQETANAERIRLEREAQIAAEERRELNQYKGKYYCTLCGHIGKRTRATKGSLVLEIALWCVFLAPGLIYSIWRQTSKYWACPHCRHESTIPADSPRARKLLADIESSGP